MIINSVTVENFRSFYGEQTVNFSTDPERNTTVIYAMNGVGKTNFLNAILWCLHGVFSVGFKNHNDILNWEAKRNRRKSYHVTIDFEENGIEYVVKRSGGDIESFKVFRINDGNRETLNQHASLFINSIIPKDMAGYFISDGEGSDLKVDQSGMISVQRSIRDILGFNVAEKTLEDLGKIKSEIRVDLTKFDKDQELSGLESRVQVFDESVAKSRKDLIENKSALEDYEIKKQQIDVQLGGASSIVVNQLQADRQRMTREKEQSQKDLNVHNAKKIALIREYSWVAFSNKLSGEALDFIDESELKGTIPAPYNTQLVEDILSQSECICGACISPGTEAFEKINRLLGKAANPVLLNRLQRARSCLIAIKTLAPQAKVRLEENYRTCSLLNRKIDELTSQIVECSNKIVDLNDDKISSLERDRRNLENKIRETDRSIVRLEVKIEGLLKDKKELEDKAGRLSGLSPRAELCRRKINLVQEIEKKINIELRETESTIHSVLEEKINYFLDRYLRQDYRAKITSDFKIGLVDRNGIIVPPSGGEGAILSFIYISSLISIARERRDLDSTILTPGAIAPLIFDAPFSKLDPKYAPSIARELPKLVDQLVIFMYQDDGKNVGRTLEEENKLGRVYYFLEESAAEQGDRKTQTISINGVEEPVTIYGAPKDKVIIREVSLNG